MDRMRKMHNEAKRVHIQKNVPVGSLVLDVGCGRGGDLHKWKKCTVIGIDPDEESIKEATKRAHECGYTWASFMHGDIHDAPQILYDVICYNFSLQYIFKSEELFESTMKNIVSRLRIGGILIGVVPDASRIPIKYIDSLGNTIERGYYSSNNQQFGNMAIVRLADGPYYANGPVPEPLCYKQFLFQVEGLELESWEKMVPEHTGLISDIYSKFIFRRV